VRFSFSLKKSVLTWISRRLFRLVYVWRKPMFSGAPHVDYTRSAVYGNARVSIGAESYANGLSVYGWGRQEVEIGAYTSIADNVAIIVGGAHDVGHVSTSSRVRRQALDSEDPSRGPVHIGSDVWIGHGVVILSGVKVHNGAVLAAGTVVTKDVPPYAIATGIPARVVRYRFDEERVAALLRIQWWSWPADVISRRADDFSDVDRFIQLYGGEAKRSISSTTSAPAGACGSTASQRPGSGDAASRPPRS
jgi:chloramphenicol O-acetyltransferase type B